MLLVFIFKNVFRDGWIIIIFGNSFINKKIKLREIIFKGVNEC